MKIKKLFMMFAIGAVALTSCNKDEAGDNGKSGENFDLYMKFDLGVASKADTEEVTTGVTTTFTNGAVFFVNSAGAIVRTAIIDDNPVGTVTATQIQSGYLFQDIDGSASEVYVIGNYDFTSAIGTLGTMDDVNALTTTIIDQTDDDFGVDNATLYGVSPITDVVVGSGSNGELAGAEREAIFTITPIIARLEIDRIGTKSGSTITGYNLAGIYINNYYFSLPITGRVPSASSGFTRTQNSPTMTAVEFSNYLRISAGGLYNPSWYEYIFDDGDEDSNPLSVGYNGISMTGSTQHTPANDTWAYNVFAEPNGNPHIILHFTDLTISGTPRANDELDALPGNNPGDNDGVAYLTVVGYNRSGTQNDEPILAGNVYKLANLLFDEDDLDDYPYEENDLKSVYVEVDVKPWTVIPVDWK